MSNLKRDIAMAIRKRNHELADRLIGQEKEEELSEAINNLSPEQRIDFVNLIKDFGNMQETIDYLREEIKKVKEKTYASNELSNMKKKLDIMSADYYRGFPISVSEKAAIDDWISEHEKEHPGGHGCSGGKYSYHFLPTGVGTSGVIRCSCGKEFEFQELG